MFTYPPETCLSSADVHGGTHAISAKKVAELTDDVEELGEKVTSFREAAIEDGEAARELRDWITVERVTIRFEAWFRAKSPGYEAIRWFKTNGCSKCC